MSRPAEVLRDAIVDWMGIEFHFPADASAQEALRTLYDSGVVPEKMHKVKPRLFDQNGQQLPRYELLDKRRLLLRPTVFH